MVRVVLVDDQTLVRQGIKSLLSLAPDIDVIGEAADGDEALTLIAAVRPDVVLLDVRMPRKNGLEVLRELQAASALPPTIVLTTFDDDELLLDVVRAGAKGYLLKDVSLEALTDAIRAVASGGTMIRPVVTERVLRGLEHVRRDYDSLSPPDALTVSCASSPGAIATGRLPTHSVRPRERSRTMRRASCRSSAFATAPGPC
jgi:DNA-binding NarL/FixJ family response regulator